jgi:hypothetical protein
MINDDKKQYDASIPSKFAFHQQLQHLNDSELNARGGDENMAKLHDGTAGSWEYGEAA